MALRHYNLAYHDDGKCLIPAGLATPKGEAVYMGTAKYGRV